MWLYCYFALKSKISHDNDLSPHWSVPPGVQRFLTLKTRQHKRVKLPSWFNASDHTFNTMFATMFPSHSDSHKSSKTSLALSKSAAPSPFCNSRVTCARSTRFPCKSVRWEQCRTLWTLFRRQRCTLICMQIVLICICTVLWQRRTDGGSIATLPRFLSATVYLQLLCVLLCLQHVAPTQLQLLHHREHRRNSCWAQNHCLQHTSLLSSTVSACSEYKVKTYNQKYYFW